MAHQPTVAQPGYPGPPPSYSQPLASGTVGNTTVVLGQPVVTVTQQYRETPVRTRCPYCNADIISETSYSVGTFAWIICIVLWFVGCFLGCCLIPFCVNSCKDCIHTCPNCRHQLGIYRRM